MRLRESFTRHIVQYAGIEAQTGAAYDEAVRVIAIHERDYQVTQGETAEDAADEVNRVLAIRFPSRSLTITSTEVP
jgi:predicted transcriptional regulator YdeE